MPSKVRSEALRGIAGVAVAAATWEIVARSGLVPTYYLPTVGRIAATVGDLDFLGNSLRHLGITVLRAMIGYCMAAAVAVPLGIMIGRIETLHALTRPILEFLRPLPASAVAPAALLFFGIGSTMNVVVVAFGSLWPILVSAIQGAATVDRTYLETARLLSLSRPRTLGAVIFPAALPYVMAGLRTSLSVALILAVTVEMIVGINGVGFAILDYERGFRVPEMYGELLILGLAGVAIDAIFRRLQREALYWLA